MTLAQLYETVERLYKNPEIPEDASVQVCVTFGDGKIRGDLCVVSTRESGPDGRFQSIWSIYEFHGDAVLKRKALDFYRTFDPVKIESGLSQGTIVGEAEQNRRALELRETINRATDELREILLSSEYKPGGSIPDHEQPLRDSEKVARVRSLLDKSTHIVEGVMRYDDGTHDAFGDEHIVTVDQLRWALGEGDE